MTLNINPSLGEHIDNEGHLPDSDINNLRNLGGRSRTTLAALALALMSNLSQSGEVNAKSFDHSLAQAMQQVGLDPSKSGEIILASSDEFDLDALLEEGAEYGEKLDRENERLRQKIEKIQENIRQMIIETQRVEQETQRVEQETQRMNEVISRMNIVLDNLKSAESSINGGGISQELKGLLEEDLEYIISRNDPKFQPLISALQLLIK